MQNIFLGKAEATFMASPEFILSPDHTHLLQLLRRITLQALRAQAAAGYDGSPWSSDSV
jgi:hypothetical protein